jgi:hypothetical protein
LSTDRDEALTTADDENQVFAKHPVLSTMSDLGMVREHAVVALSAM